LEPWQGYRDQHKPTEKGNYLLGRRLVGGLM
jgi:hypothetical protein